MFHYFLLFLTTSHLNLKKKGNTALNLAAQNGHSRVVEMLLQKGARIYKSYIGNNPFHDAAQYGSVACLKIIYNIHQCVLNTVNRDGVTKFFYFNN
jgi:transient receptor potential cation channel subfamily A protein 1